MFCNVNLWAVIVSSVVSMGIASLWYSDYVFGKQWRMYMGNLFDVPMTNKMMVKTYSIHFVTILITNYILARVLFFAGSHTWIQGATMAFYIWLGFVATIGVGSIIWDKKPCKLVAITTLSYLATLVVSGMIIASFGILGK